MSERSEYRETIDYRWTLARALDRAAEARARVHGRLTRVELKLRVAAYRATLRALYAILPSTIRDSIPQLPDNDVKKMDEWLAAVVAELDKQRLLLRKKNTSGVVEEIDDGY